MAKVGQGKCLLRFGSPQAVGPSTRFSLRQADPAATPKPLPDHKDVATLLHGVHG